MSRSLFITFKTSEHNSEIPCAWSNPYKKTKDIRKGVISEPFIWSSTVPFIYLFIYFLQTLHPILDGHSIRKMRYSNCTSLKVVWLEDQSVVLCVVFPDLCAPQTPLKAMNVFPWQQKHRGWELISAGLLLWQSPAGVNRASLVLAQVAAEEGIVLELSFRKQDTQF